MANELKTKNTRKNTNTRKRVNTNGDVEEPVSKVELTRWIVGGLLIFFAILLLIAFTSNFFTGAADQHLAVGENPHNWLGGFGVWLVSNVMNRSFGQATFFLPILMIAIAFKILQIGKVRIWKWLLNCILLTIWFSVAGALLQRFFFQESFIMLGGMHGETALDYLQGKIGIVGTFIAIIVTAIAYVGYLSGETIHFIRKTLERARKRTEQENLEKEEGNYQQDENERPTVVDLNDHPAEEEVKPANIATTITFGTDGKAEEPKPAEDVDFEVNVTDEAEGETGMKVNIGQGEEKADLDDTLALEPYDPKLDLSQYKYPTIDLL
ncbi:MAG: DNA translocase FtsK 4TM domain-containing protein, partial [Bacteroidaceae bacterium]|nr:DNA translocase FtsK 4TM domain-containing protein [Bacteroidaceae bacterium]